MHQALSPLNRSNTMNINITLDIPTIISNAVTAERIQPIVDKAIGDAIKDAINDATGYRSEFREVLKKQIAEAMPHGIRLADVAKFQHILNAALTNAVHGENAAAIKTALAKAVSSVMPEVPERIKLSELLEQAREGFHKDAHESFYAFFEPSKYSDGGGWLYLDSDPRPGESSLYSTSSHDSKDRMKHRAKTRLAISDAGEVYALKLDGVDVMPTKAPDVLGRFEGLLMSMYVGRTTIEIDIDESDVEYAAMAKED